jgi:hypothetical protein
MAEYDWRGAEIERLRAELQWARRQIKRMAESAQGNIPEVA